MCMYKLCALLLISLKLLSTHCFVVFYLNLYVRLTLILKDR